jgi:hypothetical protein
MRYSQIYPISIVVIAALQFPRSMGDLLNYVMLLSFSISLLFSAILILKHKEMGWLLFTGVGAVLIVGQLTVILIFKPQGLWLKFWVYACWWLIGVTLYLKTRNKFAVK